MRRFRLHAALIGALLLALGVGSYAVAGGGTNRFDERLDSYQEVPSVSSVAGGRFTARIANNESEVRWELSYAATEGTVTQAHIHFAQKAVNGGISVFLCSNLGNGPPGTQPCPPAPATISGTFTAADVSSVPAAAGAVAQGIGPGQLAELIRAMRAGVTYANVHSTMWPGGEIRAQLGDENRGGDDDDD